MNSGRKATIDSLARDLGVSASTVSRALNGYADISEETQRRVREAANQAGYQMASERKTKRSRTNTIGLVVEGWSNDISGPFLVQFLRGATKALADGGLDLLVASGDGPAEALETYERLIEDRKVDGFLLTRLRTDDPRIALLTQNDIPFVAHGRDSAPEDYSWLDIDAATALHDALEYLAELGHQRIGLLQGPKSINFIGLRAAAFSRTVKQLRLDEDPALVVEAGLTPEDGAKATHRIMRLPDPPTALVCDLDNLALGAFGAIRELGLEPGRDVSIVGYGDDSFAPHTTPPLTTFSQNAEIAGKWVAEMMRATLSGVSPQILQRLNPAEFVRRQSATPPAHSSDQLATMIAKTTT